MRYIKLLSSVLALCLMLTANAYATGADTSSTTEDIPDWALRPALEPGEEPEEEETPTVPTTIYDTDGSILYTNDPALLAGETATTLPAEADVSLFLQKPFEEYTVTEGYLLLFLVLGFCMLVWKLVKGVF